MIENVHVSIMLNKIQFIHSFIGMFLGARALIGVPTLNDLAFIVIPDLSLLRVVGIEEKIEEVVDPINNLHFIQNNSIEQPTLKLDETINQYYIEFDGVRNNLLLPDYQIDRLGGWGAYTTTLSILIKAYNRTAQSQFKWESGTKRFNAHIPYSDGVIFFDYRNYTSYRLTVYNQQDILGNLELWTLRVSENQKQVFRGTSSTNPIYDQVRGFA